jgi:ADP-heptose:LPS heptosyltransferase
MGDVAMTVPVLRAFTQQYPTVKITVLTTAFFKPIFRELNNVTVFTADVKGEHKGFLGLYRLSKVLKSMEIDAVADLHNVLRSNILKVFFIRTRFLQIDKGRSEKKALTTGKIFRQLKTTQQRYADVFQKLGFKIDLTSPVFPERIVLTKKIIEFTGDKNKKWIGIAPFAQYESKMYPLKLMDKVIETLSKTYHIFLFGGGKKEIEILSTLERQHSNVINLAGKLSLDEELDVISNLNLMLSMDSGNAHLAAMFGINVITIWGVTHPFAGFYPFDQEMENALLADRSQYPKIPTSIYGNKYPENYRQASQTVSPEIVVEKINSII